MFLFRYCVRPNAGTLTYGGTGEIKITLQPGPTDERHKFMVQTLTVPANYTELDKDEQAALWKEDDGRTDTKKMMSSKLICEFKLDDIPESLPELVRKDTFQTVFGLTPFLGRRGAKRGGAGQDGAGLSTSTNA